MRLAAKIISEMHQVGLKTLLLLTEPTLNKKVWIVTDVQKTALQSQSRKTIVFGMPRSILAQRRIHIYNHKTFYLQTDHTTYC